MRTTSPSAASSLLSQVRVGIVILMAAFSVMSYFDRTIISIAGPEIIREFSLSEIQMGSIYSAFLLSYAILMIPGGYLADRYGAWRVLAVVGFGAAVFTGLTALGGRPGLGALLGIVPSFVIVRLGLGVCTAPLYPSCGRMNGNWFPPGQRGRVWGVVAAGAGLGSATSPLLFSWMMGRNGWRLSFWLSAVATAALGCIWLWYARDHPWEHPALRGQFALRQETEREPAKGAGPAPWKKLLTNRNLLLLSAGYVTVNYFEYIFFYWIYYYFGQVRHIGGRQTAIYTSATFVAWMLMTPLGGWASDRLVERHGGKTGRRIIPFICLTSSASLIFIAVKLGSPAAVAGVLALSFGLASCTDGPFWACAIDVGGKHAGSASAILNTGGNLGGALAPWITPFIASRFGWSWGLYVASLILAAGTAVWFGIDSTKVN